jgi:hypothetical protein
MSNAAPVITDEQKAEWRRREETRLYDGTYTRLPGAWRSGALVSIRLCDLGSRTRRKRNVIVAISYTAAYLDHFAHVALGDAAMVAFTENDIKGAADRQTRMKPGKYLTKFFGHILSADEITKLATAFCADFAPCVLKFATSADDIEHVYTSGPSSCMSYSADDYQSSCHPVRAYGGSPDLQLAYIEPQEERITARALIWPEKKIYSRIYGDEGRLKPLLVAAGYSSGSLFGARVRAIGKNDGDGYVMPYVDGISHCERNGKYMVLGQGGIRCQHTDGTTGPEATCDHCGDGMSEDAGYYCEDDGETYCESCDANERFYCERLERTASGTRYEMANGETWCRRAFDRYGTTCDLTDANIPANEAVTMADGETWSTDAFAEFGFVCAGNGGNYHVREMVVLADDTQWCADYFADHGHCDANGENVRNTDAPLDAVVYRCPDTLELPLAVAEIAVGGWVIALDNCPGEFTKGRAYQVRDYRPDRSTPWISVMADDAGDPNGWAASNFRATFAPVLEAA